MDTGYQSAGYKRPALVTGETYHVYNRGVEGRQLYLSDDDYFRFMHDLYEFNDVNATPDSAYRFRKKAVATPDIGNPKRELLVDILAFCVMPNHFHLMLRQLMDGGISKFMRKIGAGYANYFNTRFSRSGALFQGKFKAALLCKESHYLYLPHYIHFNALDLLDESWRKGKVRHPNKAKRFLASYRWSSYLDYVGIKNYPSVTAHADMLVTYGGAEGYKASVDKRLQGEIYDDAGEIIIDDEA